MIPMTRSRFRRLLSEPLKNMMPPIFGAILVLLTFQPLAGETLVNYDPVGLQESNVPLPATTTADGVTASALSWNGGAFFNTNVYPIGIITSSPTIDLGQYISFSVTGDIFYTEVAVNASLFGSVSGPSSSSIRSSIDGFASDLDVLTGLPSGIVTNVYDISALGAVDGTVEFRIYYWDSEGGFADIVSSALGGGTGLSVRGGTTVFENPGVENANFSDTDAGQIFAARASITGDRTIRSISWSGIYDGPAPATDNFAIEVFADNGGVPANEPPIASFQVGNNVNRTSNGVFFSYTASVDFLMKSGEVYWITIYDQDGGANPGFLWGGAPGTGTNNAVSFNGGDTWTTGGNGLFAISLLGTDPTPPANDNWEDGVIGILGDVFPNTVESVNVGATTEALEQQLVNVGATVWWFIDFPADGTATIDTFGSDYDTQLHIYEGFSPGIGIEDLIPVVNNDDSSGTLQSRVEFPVEANECFEIRVGGFANSPPTFVRQGCIQLNIAFEESKDVLLGDVNCDGSVNLLDVAPFVDLVSNGGFSEKADINCDGFVNLLDVQPFVSLLSGP